MKNLPINKKIQEVLSQKFCYYGVWNVKGKGKYLKMASKLDVPVVSINRADYKNPENAVRDVIRCAKVYTRLVKEGLYHPDTQVVVCEDDEGMLTVLVLMPELERPSGRNVDRMLTKARRLEHRLNLESMKEDLHFDFNWGYDKRTEGIYAHDLHIVRDANVGKRILEIADKLGIR